MKRGDDLFLFAQGAAEKTEIACRKNRNGPLFNFYVKMDLDNGSIEEIDEDTQMEMLINDGEDPMAFLDK